MCPRIITQRGLMWTITARLRAAHQDWTSHEHQTVRRENEPTTLVFTSRYITPLRLFWTKFTCLMFSFLLSLFQVFVYFNSFSKILINSHSSYSILCFQASNLKVLVPFMAWKGSLLPFVPTKESYSNRLSSSSRYKWAIVKQTWTDNQNNIYFHSHLSHRHVNIYSL